MVGAVGLALLLAACSSANDDDGAPATTAAGDPEWPVANHDLANTRTASGSAITTDNVDALEEEWRSDFPGSGVYGTLSTTPLVLGDTAYLQSLTGEVAAVEVETGEDVWRHDASLPGQFQAGPNGVAVGEGMVFAIAGSTSVVALDAETGDEVWLTAVGDTPTTGIDIQPVVHDGKVFVSTVPIGPGIFTPGDRGVIKALDTRTGEEVWAFDTIESEDLWGHPEINSGGGAWYPPAVDPERGLVYFGTGNPAPFAGATDYPNGSSRPGDNRYTSGTVALDIDTGELAWFHQDRPHDLYDHDHMFTLLADTEEGPLVITAGKSGRVYGLDPDSGDVRWEQAVGMHENDDLEAFEGETEVLPGQFGGIETPPAVADGVVYVAVLNAASTYVPDQQLLNDVDFGTHDGQVVALDAATGEVIWDVDVPGDALGGATVVNDLVFTSLLDGTLLALDREDGDLVWEHDAGGLVNAWPAAVGNRILFPVGGGDPPHLLSLAVGG